MNKNIFYIGEVGELTGASSKAIRMYEEMTIIPIPNRNKSGYRVYTLGLIERIKVIKTAQNLGFKLSEIKSILHDSTLVCTTTPWDNIIMLIQDKIINNNSKIENLKKENIGLNEFCIEIKNHHMLT
ncbi:MAG: MerR family transcriptional regulator [Spirochaetaceae bacterium]